MSTSSQTNPLDYAAQMQAVGTNTVTTGGTAETVTLGWVPRYVRAFSQNNLTSYEYFEGMTADDALTVGNHADTQVALATSGGITLTANGFTLGTAICDTTSDVVRWLAIR
jgi:hypothetical protein